MEETRASRWPLAGVPALPMTVLLLVVLLVYASTYLLISLLPVYIRGQGHSEASVGTIMSLFSIAALATRPFAGVLADRAGRAYSICVGGLFIGLGCAGYIIAGPNTIFLARLVNGIGWGAVTAATATVAADLAPPNRRGTVLGVYGTITGMALAVGPSVGIWLSNHASLHISFIVASVCGFGAAIAVPFLRAPAPPQITSRTGIGLAQLFSRSAVGPASIMLCFSLIYGTVLTFIPLMTIDRGLGESGPFFAVFAVGLIFLRISGGGLSDRLGRFKIIGPGFVSCAIAMFVLAYTHSNVPLYTAAILFAVAFAFVQPASQAWAVDLSPLHARATTLSTVVAAQDFGISFGAIGAGFIAEGLGYTVLFMVAMLIALCGLAVAITVQLKSAKRVEAVEVAV
ncbi:MAG TPA: MFS transporter [Nitrolancea sp.]|nr:MFS transporter [Nitrolancea sp.]